MSTSIMEFFKQQFSRHGIPDCGPHLINSEFTAFVRTWQFTYVRTSPYHNQSNGKVESTVKIVKSIIKVSARQNSCLYLIGVHSN